MAMETANDSWSMDFMSDQLFQGCCFRVLTLVLQFHFTKLCRMSTTCPNGGRDGTGCFGTGCGAVGGGAGSGVRADGCSVRAGGGAAAGAVVCPGSDRAVDRKNGWQLADYLGDETPKNLQHFIARSQWNSLDEVRDDLQQYVIEHLADDDGVLIVDETGFLKRY